MNENSGRLLRMIVLAFGGVESFLAGVLLSSHHAPDGSVRRDRSGHDGFKTMKDMRQGMMTGTLRRAPSLTIFRNRKVREQVC